jgi:hypothetical protein
MFRSYLSDREELSDLDGRCLLYKIARGRCFWITPSCPALCPGTLADAVGRAGEVPLGPHPTGNLG